MMFSWPWHLGNLDWGPVYSAVFGLALFSAASVAIGLLISSVMRSQAVAFFVTFFVLVLLWMMGEFTDYVGQEISQTAANAMEGEVWDIAYLGDMTVYHIKLGDGQVVKASELNSARVSEDPLTWSDRAWISFAPDAGVVLTR